MLDNDIENEISEFFKINKHSLCDIFILKSIFDVTDYSTKDSTGRWNGVTKLEDRFVFDLDFIASSLAHYYWRPSFYFGLTVLPHISNIDLAIYKILKDFKENYKKNRGVLSPKRIFLCAKSTKNYREKIKNKIQKESIMTHLDKKFTFFRVLDDGEISIKKNIICKINKKHLNKKLDEEFSNYFSKHNILLSEITIEKQFRSSQLPKSIFNSIKGTQTNCFYCNDTSFNVQEHVIPEQLVGETIISNIVASCKKCNQRKWDYLPTAEIFEHVLLRNEEHPDMLECCYDRETFKGVYDGFRKIGIPVIPYSL